MAQSHRFMGDNLFFKEKKSTVPPTVKSPQGNIPLSSASLIKNIPLSSYENRQGRYNRFLISETEGKNENPNNINKILSRYGDQISIAAKKKALERLIEKNWDESFSLVLNNLTQPLTMREIQLYMGTAIMFNAGGIIKLLDNYIKEKLFIDFKNLEPEVLYCLDHADHLYVAHPVKLAHAYQKNRALEALNELGYFYEVEEKLERSVKSDKILPENSVNSDTQREHDILESINTNSRGPAQGHKSCCLIS